MMQTTEMKQVQPQAGMWVPFLCPTDWQIALAEHADRGGANAHTTHQPFPAGPCAGHQAVLPLMNDSKWLPGSDCKQPLPPSRLPSVSLPLSLPLPPPPPPSLSLQVTHIDERPEPKPMSRKFSFGSPPNRKRNADDTVPGPRSTFSAVFQRRPSVSSSSAAQDHAPQRRLSLTGGLSGTGKARKRAHSCAEGNGQSPKPTARPSPKAGAAKPWRRPMVSPAMSLPISPPISPPMPPLHAQPSASAPTPAPAPVYQSGYQFPAAPEPEGEVCVVCVCVRAGVRRAMEVPSCQVLCAGAGLMGVQW